MNNIWYTYGELDHETTNNAEPGHLDVYVYDTSNSGTYSGIAKDFSILETSKFTFSANIRAYQGGNEGYGFYIFKKDELIPIKSYKYTLDLSTGDGLENRMISIILEPGEYTLLVGRYNHRYEFWASKDEIIISPASKIDTTITHTRSVWNWNGEGLDNFDEFLKICLQLRINCIYHYTSHTDIVPTNTKLIDFINNLKKYNIDFYFAMGNPEWYNDLEKIDERLNLVVNFIHQTGCKVDGIVYDIESYTSDAETPDGPTKDERIAIFGNNLAEVYKNCRAYNLKTIVAIPTWFKEDIISIYQTNCDGLTLMNYATTDTINRIKEEIAEAKKQNKWIETIAELNPKGLETESWYSKGLIALEEDFDKIKRTYNYNKLSISYHHWDELKQLYYEEGGINMPLFKSYKCLESQLSNLPIIDGQLIFTTDTNKIYLDMNGARGCYTRTNIKTYVSKEQPTATSNGDIWLIIEGE